MGAETTYWVKVGKLRYEWVEVSAVTASEAYALAFNLPGVASVVEATHEEPSDIPGSAGKMTKLTMIQFGVFFLIGCKIGEWIVAILLRGST